MVGPSEKEEIRLFGILELSAVKNHHVGCGQIFV
jgi:hypothetical protein